jgi:hypothetical protein
MMQVSDYIFFKDSICQIKEINSEHNGLVKGILLLPNGSYLSGAWDEKKEIIVNLEHIEALHNALACNDITEGIINLKPLEEKPLSTQLSKLTGEGWHTGNFRNLLMNRDASAWEGNIIVNVRSGEKFRLPMKSWITQILTTSK